MKLRLVCFGLVAACGGESAPVGSAPFTPIEVASRDTENGATPMFLVTATGARVLAWVTAPGGGTEGRLRVAVTPAAGAAPTRNAQIMDPLGPIEPHGEAPPQLGADAAGGLYIVYTVGREVAGERFPRSALRLVRSGDGGMTWTTPVTVNEGEAFGSHSFHGFLASGDGRLFISWIGDSRVWLRRSDDGGRTWHDTQVIHHGPACPCCRTSLAMGPDGAMYASWRTILSGDVRDVVVARSTDGGATWQQPVRPREDGWVFPGCPHAGPSLRVDAGGVVHIAWWTGKEGSAGVYYARSTDGANTFSAVPIAVGSRSTPAHVQLAIGPDGPVVAWDDGHGPIPKILLRASADSGVSFGPGVLVSRAEAAGSFPVLGVVGDSLRVAWSSMGTGAHRAEDSTRHARSHSAPTGLPRVGQREILQRSAALRDLLPR
jgi:hypothetical protein